MMIISDITLDYIFRKDATAFDIATDFSKICCLAGAGLGIVTDFYFMFHHQKVIFPPSYLLGFFGGRVGGRFLGYYVGNKVAERRRKRYLSIE